MKIATFNANSIRTRIPIILNWLNDNKPDVLAIQETKVQDADFPIDSFASSGYEINFKGQKAYNGVALFTKTPAQDVSFGLDDEPKDESRLIAATVNGVRFVNTYIPQGTTPDSDKFVYKLEWFKRLKKYFTTQFRPTDNVIWLGDLNVAIEARDVHNAEKMLGSVCYCPEVIQTIKDVMAFGFTDTFRMHCDLDEQYSFWDYRVPNGFKRNVGWRLDYIMATKPLADKCTWCIIDKEPRQQEKPSDHTFVVAEFDI
jgi:exodeoxyribonuclease III